jgi:hypothetical protein
MSNLNSILTSFSIAANILNKEESYDPGEMDEKLMNFFTEILECWEFAIAMKNHFEEKEYEFAKKEVLVLLNEMGEFYEKNSEKLNEKQLAYQFAKSKGFLSTYKLYKKAEKNGAIVRE